MKPAARRSSSFRDLFVRRRRAGDINCGEAPISSIAGRPAWRRNMAPEEQSILHSIIRAELGDPSLSLQPETVIRELPGIESMKVLRIITKIERQFQIEMDDEVVFNMGTYGDLVNALDRARAEAAL
jgi:acyl carrier protein